MNRDIVFYNYMTLEQQDLLNRSMQQASFRKGQIVHRHGDSCVGLIFVRKGRLAFSILSEEGRGDHRLPGGKRGGLHPLRRLHFAQPGV